LILAVVAVCLPAGVPHGFAAAKRKVALALLFVTTNPVLSPLYFLIGLLCGGFTVLPVQSNSRQRQVNFGGSEYEQDTETQQAFTGQVRQGPGYYPRQHQEHRRMGGVTSG